MQKLFVVTSLLLLFVGASALVPGDPNAADYDEDYDRDLGELEAYTGEVNSKCNRRNPCRQGLDCVRGLRNSICYPMTCLSQAADETFMDLGKDNIVKSVLELAGLTPQALLNRTALEESDEDENLADASRLSRFLNLGVRERIQDALQEDTTALNYFQGKGQKCFPKADEDAADTYQDQSFYLALHIETGALFFKAIIQLGSAAYSNGTVPDDGCFSSLCVGAGLDVDVHVTPTLGVLASAEPTDIRRNTFMTDSDFSFFLHWVGGAVGWTDRNQFRAEWSSFIVPFVINQGYIPAFGVGGGVSAYGCVSADPPL